MLIYNKIRDVKDPVRAHRTDAGIDLFIPNDFKETTLKIGDSVLIPSGIRIKLPENTAGIFFNKSSVAKKGIIFGATLVDEGYNGEVHIHLIKVSGEPVTIKAGDKVAQLVVMPVLYTRLVEYNNEQYKHATLDSERQNKGFGSTGDK
jgi:dUTP pyrophosphatase